MRCSTTELYRRSGGQGIAGQANVKAGGGTDVGMDCGTARAVADPVMVRITIAAAGGSQKQK